MVFGGLGIVSKDEALFLKRDDWLSVRLVRTGSSRPDLDLPINFLYPSINP